MSHAPTEARFNRLLSWLLSERIARLFVWAVWLGLLVMALSFVQRFALRLPCCDDWTQYVGPLTDGEPFDLARLWQQNNEHRLPLIHLIVYPLARLTNGVFWLENLLNALLLGGLAAILIVTARRLRGVQRHSDAFFPLALLNLGRCDVFMGRLMLNHVLSAVLVSLVLAVIALQRGPLTIRRTCLIGLLLLCLPLCGANGLPVVVLCAAWLLVGARAGAPAPAEGWKRVRMCHVAVAGAALLLVGVYFVGFHFPEHHAPPPDALSALRTFGQCLNTSYIWWSPKLWPWSGLVVPAAVLATAMLMLWTCWQRPTERGRALALLMFLAAAVGTAAGIAWGRAAIEPNIGIASRYGLITLPALLCVYLAWLVYGRESLGRWVQRGLFALFCVTLFVNARHAFPHGRWIHQQEEAIVRALHEGAPPDALVQLGAGVFHSPSLNPLIADRMRALRAAGIAPFHALRDTPRWVENALTSTPQEVCEMTRDGREGDAHGSDPRLFFRFKEVQFVHALRIRCVLKRPQAGPTPMEFFWKQTGVDEYSHKRNHAVLVVESGDKEHNLLVWVNGPLDELRIDPDVGPCHFELRELTLLRKREETMVANRAR